MLRRINFIENVGRFEKALPTQNVRFEKCTFFFGENGWGKSTIADILRSLTLGDPGIIVGRKTLAGGPDQKISLQLDSGRANFEGGSWNGAQPRAAVFDSLFVNDNVYSGDTVSADHLRRQYGLVVGEKGVKLVRQIVALDGENTENNKNIRALEAELTAGLRGIGPSAMSLSAFEALEDNPDIDTAIADKQAEVSRAAKSKELKAAAGSSAFPLPSEPATFEAALNQTVEGIAADAVEAVRSHVAAHECAKPAEPGLETWLEQGLPFKAEDTCPFCGQELRDRSLLEAYSRFFSEAYRKLAENVQKLRQICQRYSNGEFRTAAEQGSKSNKKQFEYWREAADIDAPATIDLEALISGMERAAAEMDSALQAKAANLTVALDMERLGAAVYAWTSARAAIESANAALVEYNRKVDAVKTTVDTEQLERLTNELKALQAQKHRLEAEIISKVTNLQTKRQRKGEIAKEKAKLRDELTTHGKTITESLGNRINAYLERLNAGFRIDYKEPDYRGKEPAASYRILINEVPVSPRASGDTTGAPSFRNTLSAGDKSVLALALFLAQCNADPDLGETIIVLDDPFTSLDNFRRQFTAIEIRRICDRAKQTIVLSHDKGFLRLLWDKIDQKLIKSFALQTGAPGVTTITPYDIPGSTQPRHVTERMKIEEFIEGEPHELSYIRSRLRTVCEDFYRKADPGLFGEAATLDQIIRALNDAHNDHPFKGALEDLKDINAYSRVENHAEINGDPYGDTNPDELRGFCSLVLGLTRGM
ncbi:AAA family ATPase [Ruegeria jejuensis]|uniref:AAA family ATPase n=1 Tax=Ruegeria jejuensis TaxID=3233338 RepID=UPI00355C7F25